MRNSLFRIVAFVLSLGLAPSLAYADQSGSDTTATDAKPAATIPSVCAAESTEAAQLQCVNDEDALVQAEAKLADDRKKLAQDSGEDLDSDKARNISVPNVPLIVGGGKSPLTAVLAYSDGRTLTVHAGETVPGDFVVRSISSSPAEVVLDHNGQSIFLLMGGGGASELGANQDTQDNSQQPPAMPPVAPLPSNQ